MAHSVFTIVADVIPENLAALDGVLADIQAHIDDPRAPGHPRIDFGLFESLHFASFVVFDRTTRAPFLVFENSVDGSSDEYVDQLLACAGPGIDAVYQHCADYSHGMTVAEQRDYLTTRVRKPHVYHIGTAYRHARYIKEDQALRRDLETRVDALMNPSLRAQIEAKVPVLPRRPSWPRLRRWVKGIVAAAVTALLIALVINFLWARHPYLAGSLVLALAVTAAWYLRTDWDRARRLNALLEATAHTASPVLLWRQLQREFPVRRYAEPRALERIKNWSMMLWPVPVATVIIRYLWDKHWYLFGLIALAFFLKALWLSILVGWPKKGQWKPALWFVPLAASVGAIIGLWPWQRAVAPFLAGVLLGAVGFIWMARILPARRARQTRGTWPIVPFVVLAAVLSWLSILAGRVVWSVTVDWIARHISTDISGFLSSTPTWLEWGIQGLVALVTFASAFIVLVFVSAMPPPSMGLFKVPYVGLLFGAGAAALIFWGASKAPWLTPWLGALALGVVSLVALFSLWAIPLPAPTVKVRSVSSRRLRDLKAQEDMDVQNHMATMVRIRAPRRTRAFLLMLFLRTLNRVFYRTVLPDLWYHSTLFGIPTVHFAQWTVLDKTRHMFLSNYDFSWTSYLDDFGSHLTTGIQKIWGQSKRNPGVADVGAFKRFVRTQMVPYQVWYRAYPSLTAEQIKNNEQIRLGLLKKDVDEETSVELLRRLAAIEVS